MDEFEIEGGVLKKYNGRKRNVVIPEGVTAIGSYAFCYCNTLKTVTVPKGVVRIEESAFEDCDTLIGITLPEGIEYIGDHAFRWCYQLEAIRLPESLTVLGKYAFYECRLLDRIEIPSGIKVLGEHLFDSCRRLEEVKLHEGLEFIGGQAFYGCTSLREIDVPDSVSVISGSAFFGCTALEGFAFPEGVGAVNCSTLEGCRSVRNVYLSGGITEIGERAFEGCRSLEEIRVSADNQSYKSMDGNLYSRDGRTLVAYAAGKRDASFSIPEGVEAIGDFAFRNCVDLKRVFIPASVKSVKKTAFEGCLSMEEMSIEGCDIDQYDTMFMNELPQTVLLYVKPEFMPVLELFGSALGWYYSLRGFLCRYYSDSICEDETARWHKYLSGDKLTDAIERMKNVTLMCRYITDMQIITVETAEKLLSSVRSFECRVILMDYIEKHRGDAYLITDKLLSLENTDNVSE